MDSKQISETENISFEQVTLKEGYWKKKSDLIRSTTIHSVYERFDETGRIGAFRCDWKEGSESPKPHVFWDSDVAKWMESVAYLIQKGPEPELEEKVDALVAEIEAHQREDGYFNIYFLTVEPGKEFTNRDRHELYCAGHLLEAAIAYKRATGKDRFYRLMLRYIDYIDRVFRVEHSAAFRTPGHEEIELALIKLYHESGEERYLDLALYFLNLRGSEEERNNFPSLHAAAYSQSRLPIRKQTEAEGHAVRLCYLYIAAAEAAYLRKDRELANACEAVFRDIVCRKMYITGGIGSTPVGEAFEEAYHLPNELAYCETCASIGLALFAHRMQLLSDSSLYADIIERELYNGILAGLSLDGTSFFYENPLEIVLKNRTRKNSGRKTIVYPIPERVKVFQCSCCPPNLTRIIPTVGNFLYTKAGDSIRVNQYMASETQIGGLTLTQTTRYPNKGDVTLTLTGGNARLGFRIPGWCRNYTLPDGAELQNGYAYYHVNVGESVTLHFEMPVEFVEADPRIAEDAGKVAVTCGPFVYCAEAIDNQTALFPGAAFSDIRLSPEMPPHRKKNEELGLYVLDMTAFRREIPFSDEAPLYSIGSASFEPVPLRLIPYAAYANRGESDMQVWFLRYDKKL